MRRIFLFELENERSWICKEKKILLTIFENSPVNTCKFLQINKTSSLVLPNYAFEASKKYTAGLVCISFVKFNVDNPISVVKNFSAALRNSSTKIHSPPFKIVFAFRLPEIQFNYPFSLFFKFFKEQKKKKNKNHSFDFDRGTPSFSSRYSY